MGIFDTANRQPFVYVADDFVEVAFEYAPEGRYRGVGYVGNAAPPIVAVTSGNGLTGSVYSVATSSGVPGQFYADGEPIPDATGLTWTMAAAYLGAAISYRKPNGAVSNAIQMWTPAQLGSKLVGWCDASTIQAVGTAVPSWYSRAGSIPIDFAQGRGDAPGQIGWQPTYDATGFNGLPGVVFNGQKLLSAAAPPDTFAACFGADIAFVKTGAAASDSLIHRTGMGVNPAVNLSACPFSAFATNRLIGNGVTVANRAGPSINLDTSPCQRSFEVTPTGYAEFRDGVSAGVSAAAPANYADASDQISLGARRELGVGLTGAMGQVVLWNAPLTVDERQALEGFTAHSLGLTASLASDHPYKTSAPRIAA